MSYSLFLFADNSDDIVFSKSDLIDYLTDLEFITSPAGSSSLKPGDLLMEFITFLGCSPSLKLGEIESTIRIHFFNRVTGMGGESIETIRYPICKHPVHEPGQLVKSFPDVSHFQCPLCGVEGMTDIINWRKSAGFAKVFIEIDQIFPKEAVPSDKLLYALQSFSHSQWQWFYSKASSEIQ